METKMRHLSEIPASTGIPEGVSDPIKPDLLAGKHETQLAKAVGLTQFGVNHVRLDPGSMSSLRHWHEGEDEFIYVLSGELVLIDGNGEHLLKMGSFAGFRAGLPNAHHVANKSASPATFLVVGTRKRGIETIHYPDDSIGRAVVERDGAGERVSRSS